MEQIGLVTIGICAVICTFIICVTQYILDGERRHYRNALRAFMYRLAWFAHEFNETYSNTQIEIDEDGIYAVDVEPENAE